MNTISPTAVLPPSAAPAPRSGSDNNPSGSSQPSPRTERGEFSITFSGGDNFAAFNAACAWLKARGFSVGKLQAGCPVGVMHGEARIEKWTHLDAEARADLHAVIAANDFRNGPVTIHLDWHAPSAVVEAFNLTDEDQIDLAAQEAVEAHP